VASIGTTQDGLADNRSFSGLIESTAYPDPNSPQLQLFPLGSVGAQIWLSVDVWAASGVPEPETYAMMLAGLGLLGFVARRRKLKAA
jgi:hypothetical protein